MRRWVIHLLKKVLGGRGGERFGSGLFNGMIKGRCCCNCDDEPYR